MVAGSGKASAATRSNSAASATSSSSFLVVASMAGIIAVTRFMLNARAAGLPSQACFGSSRLHIGHQGDERGLRHGRGVGGRILEDLLDVGVAGDDVVADRRGEEDGDAPLREGRQGRGWIGGESGGTRGDMG